MRRTLLHAAVVLSVIVARVQAECHYQGVVYASGSTVAVQEACLRCVCARTALQCALRVCAAQPDPPPPGCVLLHRRRACCAELRCQDDPVNTNRIEARFEPEIPEIPFNQSMIGTAGCVSEGTVYGSGSAMHSAGAGRCALCYCLAGRAQCVRPRCTLPAPACTPVFHTHACCPTRYKCRAPYNKDAHGHTNTDGSCVVKGTRHSAGSLVGAAALGPCDRCYCVRGAVRCTRLHCAPPLPGCAPLVPPGQCCASSYNCSGTIEVQPLLNYDKPPDVSPDYAKLRKEVHHMTFTKPHESSSSKDSKYPHYVVAESHYQPIHTQIPQKPSTPYYFTSTSQPRVTTVTPTRRHYVATTKHLPLAENSNPESSGKYSRISLTTTRVANGDKPSKLTTERATSSLVSSVILSPVYNPNEYYKYITKNIENSTPKLQYSNYIDDVNDDLYLDGRNNRRIDDQLDFDINSTTETTTNLYTNEYTNIYTNEYTTESVYTTDSTTDLSTTQTETELTTLETTTYSTTTVTDDITSKLTTQPENIDSNNTSELRNNNKSTPETAILNDEPLIKLIGNNSECIDGPIDDIKVETKTPQLETIIDEITTSVETTAVPTTTENLKTTETEASNLSATTVPFKKISTDIETINKKDEDYEYDYNLQPNLEIIPFVAADAVVDQDGGGTAFPPHQDALRETDDPLYPYNHNLFSPPQETEGGFVPRDPPPLVDTWGDAAGGGTEVNCVLFGQELRHGALTAPPSNCMSCTCLFGVVVCQPPNCNDMSKTATLVVERMDVTELAVADTDPFRDVIRTEPAPDLHSLIGDRPLHQYQPQQQQHNSKQEDKQTEERDSFYDALFQLLSGEDKNSTTTSTSTSSYSTTSNKYTTTNTPWAVTSPVPHHSTTDKSTTDMSSTNAAPSNSGLVGLLKLAGCNIYGRMYRVGKIIAELSGPCLQCTCTDTGVQCDNLPC